ncbi:MAG: OmpH family outer membrane protein [Rhodobacteraceae bacterium]|nr:OmpH family outer membrane protein [Paracoccaceae bacterium]
MNRRGFVAGGLAALTATAGVAQTEFARPQPVVTIDPERLFSETAYGQRVLDAVEARSAELVRENRRIEAELIAEERSLTDQRPTLPIEEFRALADAFDEKVQRIRAEQDAKTREVQTLREAEQQRFFTEIAPVLSILLHQRGADVVIDRRSVFLSSGRVDITDDAIAIIDARLGDGASDPTTKE